MTGDFIPETEPNDTIALANPRGTHAGFVAPSRRQLEAIQLLMAGARVPTSPGFRAAGSPQDSPALIIRAPSRCEATSCALCVNISVRPYAVHTTADMIHLRWNAAPGGEWMTWTSGST
jgi:hypothetical protein